MSETAEKMAIEIAKKANIALIDPNGEDIKAIDTIAKEFGLVHADGSNPFSEGLKMANGIALLRTTLNNNVMGAVMTLQGSPLGFKTDKDKEGGYPMPVVRDAVIEALMRGVHVIGNEFNIISSRCYITKEGFGTLLAKIPTLRYSMTPGIPKIVQNGAEVSVRVDWKINGEEHTETLTFLVKVQNNMGSDALCGKAVRKSRCWLYNHITGFELTDADLEADLDAQGGNLNVANSRFATAKKTTKNASVKVESATVATPKKDEAETIEVATEEISDAAEINNSEAVPPSLEQQYPRLCAMLKERNAPVSIQDICNWHLAFKIAVNEGNILAQFDKCVNDCLTWLEAQRQQ